MKGIKSSILRPLITEKSSKCMAEGKYVFKVCVDVNKIEIRKEIEKLFQVTIIDVNTMRCEGKFRRQGRRLGKQSDWKKVIVSLKEGDKIGFFESIT